MTMKIIRFILILAVIAGLSGCKNVTITTANAQYERGEYFEAQKSYRKLYNSYKKRDQREDKAFAALRSGMCYYKLNQTTRAVNAFKNALRYGTTDSTAYLLLAQSLMRQGKYKEAEENYRQYLELDSLSTTALNGLKSIALATNKDRATRYVVKEAKFINGRRADFAPAFAAKDFDRIYFTTNNEQAVGNVRSGITGLKNTDVWSVSKNENGEWLKPEPVEGGLNTEFDEGILSISPDGSTMYLSRAERSGEKDSYVSIWTSRRTDAQWSEPQPFELGDTLNNYAHPAVSPDGKYLYFASDRPGGYGGYDLWRINLDNRGNAVENLGPEINTPGNELFPYLRNDSTLYFASDGHPGFGGLDLFKATHASWFEWNVVNMGQPVNSGYDDFGIAFEDGEKGFFSSNRGDERGYDHIYTFELPELNIFVNGYVMDPEEYIIPDASIRIIGNDGSNRRERVKNDGSFSFNLERGVDYILQATAKGFLNANQHFTSDIEETDAEYIVDFTLAPINRPIVVDDIFYDFDKATLRPESKMALDSLVSFLNEYPYVTIELSSHTDRVGSEAYNDNLSMRRAMSVVDYLINEGKIDSRRLLYKGYGKSQPRTVTPRLHGMYPEFEVGTQLTPEFIEALEDPAWQEDADQINRRTEFEITSVDFFLY